MTKSRRLFTPEDRNNQEDRLSLIREAEREGFMDTYRKYNLSPTLLSGWKRKYLEKGSEGLKPAYKKLT